VPFNSTVSGGHRPPLQKQTNGRSQTFEILAQDAALGFVELGKLVEDFEGCGVEAPGAPLIAAHLMDDGEVSEAEADFGMVRTEKLLADPEGLHVALLGAEEVAALAEDGAEVGGDEGGFAMDRTMTTRRLVESASEKNGSFFQLTGEFAQHREAVLAYRARYGIQ
jgi:hypothetical protein